MPWPWAGFCPRPFTLATPNAFIKAFSQWRSSWLSREGVLAVAALVIMGLYALGLIFFDARWSILGLLGAALSLATVFATAMIYAQMKTVPRWHSWTVPVQFLAYALTGGALMTGKVTLALWLLPLLAAVQTIAWALQDRQEKNAETTIATATGLGAIGSVRAFEAPHTGENYLTREMVFRVGRKHAATLKAIAVFLFAALPLIILLLPFHHMLAVLAILAHLAGVLVQRWLFFAEAKHVVSHYYGR